MTYFTADPHFYHENIIKFCNRPFSSAEEMNKVIIKNINETVNPDDELYILGDFGFSDVKQTEIILRQFNCKNLHYVFGNHDKTMRQPQIKKYFKTMSEYKKIVVEGQAIILFHYPILEWDAGHRGSWMLHGHCHGTQKYPEELKNKKIVDIGLDCWQYRAVSFNELKSHLKDKENITYNN